ncbi:mesoderm-specific transcript protein-like isoform X2 [Rhopilema esculentum]|uniref:mesoderm-specific transcript protein-like isoform X2 n=1 Tax=Rhopilema esculentum TaxID=499914 RepID=UPI0031CF9C68
MKSRLKMASRRREIMPRKSKSRDKAVQGFLGSKYNYKTLITYFSLSFLVALLLGLFVSSPAPSLSPRLADWRDSGYIFNFSGFSIFYQDIPKLKLPRTGPDILLLHGFPTSSYDWKKVIFSLHGHFGRVIAVDMLGLGFSDKPSNHEYSISEQATIHEDLLKHLGIKDIHLLAHDLGDTVAQEMLARYLERISKAEEGLAISSLCLTNGGIFPETHHPRLVQKLLRLPFIGNIAAFLMTFTTFKYSFSAIFGPSTRPSADELWDFWTQIRFNDGHLATPRLLRYMDERRTYRSRWVGALEKTEIPLHYIYGGLDPINPESALKLYRSTVTNSSVTVLQNAGHYPHWEDAEGFLKGYFEFLDRIGVARS